jgi:hypothetical protein
MDKEHHIRKCTLHGVSCTYFFPHAAGGWVLCSDMHVPLEGVLPSPKLLEGGGGRGLAHDVVSDWKQGKGDNTFSI